MASAKLNVEVMLHSYSNPTSEVCNGGNCDGLFGTCDNVFIFCLRIIRHSSCSGMTTTDDLEDDDFSFTPANIATLEIRNPLIFSNLTVTVCNNLWLNFTVFLLFIYFWKYLFLQDTMELYIRIEDDDFFSRSDHVDDIIVPLDRTLGLKSTFTPPTTYNGTCRKANITISLRISSNCLANKYGPTCSVNCTDLPNQYYCNYLGEIQCLGNFATPDCTQCLPTYYTSTCSVQCFPTTSRCMIMNYQCDQSTGQKVCSSNYKGVDCDSCQDNYYGNCCNTFCLPSPNRYTCDSDGNKVCEGNFKPPDCTECENGFQGPDCNTCATDYYPPNTCNVYCRPQNDSNGHYICDPTTGEIICLPGYTGALTMCTEIIGNFH